MHRRYTHVQHSMQPEMSNWRKRAFFPPTFSYKIYCTKLFINIISFSNCVILVAVWYVQYMKGITFKYKNMINSVNGWVFFLPFAAITSHKWPNWRSLPVFKWLYWHGLQIKCAMFYTCIKKCTIKSRISRTIKTLAENHHNPLYTACFSFITARSISFPTLFLTKTGSASRK